MAYYDDPEKQKDLRERDLPNGLRSQAQYARLLNMSRAEFCELAGAAWDDECTEDGRARRLARQREGLSRLLAHLDDPEYQAELRAAEDREIAAMTVAKETRAYPVHYPAAALGKVLRVERDGAVRIGRVEANGAIFVPESSPHVVELRLTCQACPELYDAFLGERKIGYLRFRHGVFRADYDPDGVDETVLSVCVDGASGRFQPEDRDQYLDHARAMLYERWLQDQP